MWMAEINEILNRWLERIQLLALRPLTENWSSIIINMLGGWSSGLKNNIHNFFRQTWPFLIFHSAYMLLISSRVDLDKILGCGSTSSICLVVYTFSLSPTELTQKTRVFSVSKMPEGWSLLSNMKHSAEDLNWRGSKKKTFQPTEMKSICSLCHAVCKFQEKSWNLPVP